MWELLLELSVRANVRTKCQRNTRKITKLKPTLLVHLIHIIKDLKACMLVILSFPFIEFWTKQMKYIFCFIVNIIKRLEEYLGKCSVIIDLSA